MARLAADLADFARREPGQAEAVDRTLALLAAAGSRAAARSHCPGHLTGSAWLVSADGERVLLTHHRKLGRWLQPGGHADGCLDLADVALREAREESGLCRLSLDGTLFDVDVHAIPALGPEPAHEHHDLRYVVVAADDDFLVGPESLALAWWPIPALVEPAHDPSIRRMARRWLARGFPGCA